MMRLAALFWLTVAGIVALFLFHVKYEVQHLEEELQMTHRQIIEEQEAIHILAAEWSYLNRPERIGNLAKEHLGLQPPETRQLASLAVLPERPEDMGVDSPNSAELALANVSPDTAGVETAMAEAAPAPLPRVKPKSQLRLAAQMAAQNAPRVAAQPKARDAAPTVNQPIVKRASDTGRSRPLPAAVEATLASLRTPQ
jgi:cell division protein FtsL